jgi:hypothetical protein
MAQNESAPTRHADIQPTKSVQTRVLFKTISRGKGQTCEDREERSGQTGQVVGGHNRGSAMADPHQREQRDGSGG